MYGQTATLGLALQNSWGTPNVSSLFWIPFISESIALDIPALVSQANVGNFDEGEHNEGPRTAGGDLGFEAQSIPLGAVLAAFFGTPTSTKESSADVYNHLFVPASGDYDTQYSAGHPCTIIKNRDVGSADRFSDMNAATLEMSINNGEFLMATVGFVGGHFQQVAKVTPSLPTGRRWTWDQTSVGLGGSGNSKVTQLSIKMDQAIEPQHTLNGSSYPDRIKRTGFRKTEITGTIKFDDQDEYQDFLNQTEQELTVNLVGKTAISSGYYDAILFQVPLFRFTEFKPNAGGPGQIEVSFTSKGVYSQDSGATLQVTLTNTQTAYP